VGCIRIVLGLAFLLVSVASVAILVKIKGTSDGPGALLMPTAPKE
jgi:hypothetical protein